MLSDKLVLIVDDDNDLREELVAFLNGYLVKTIEAKNAEDARGIIEREKIDLLLCDILMPGESGLELTKWVIDHKNIPVVLLSSLDDVADRITGLEVGADDYITKPFAPRELLARLKSVLRRFNKTSETNNNNSIEPLYTLNDYDELISISGATLKLRPADAKLLRILAQHQGSSVSREELYTDVLNKTWNPQDRAIDNMIARLRSQLEEDTAKPKIILTARNTGYSITTGVISIASQETTLKNTV